MRSLKSTAAVLAAAAALVLGGGLGSAAAAAPAASPRTAVSPRAATIACNSTALAGGTVRGALTPAQVQRDLSSLSAQHRAQFGLDAGHGIPAKGALGPTASASTSASAPASGSAVRPLVDIHPAAGTSFKSQSGDDGSCATQSVSTTLTVHNNATTIYTPTMYPPGGSCVELVTVYSQTVRSVSAWDWCKSVNFAASVPINSSFLSTYTNGSGAYTGRVVRTSTASNTWTASLYNYAAGRWDTLFTQSGTNQSGRTDGWDIEELYSSTGSSGHAYSCDDMAGLTFESSGISVRKNGVWSTATTANADTHYDQPNSAFYCPTRSYQMISTYDHWKDVG